MIGITMDGRLGNQFFRYAMARRLRWERGEQDDLIINFNTTLSRGTTEEGFEDELKYFNVLPYVTSTRGLARAYCSLPQKALWGMAKLVGGGSKYFS